MTKKKIIPTLPVRKGHGTLALTVAATGGLLSGLAAGFLLGTLVDPAEVRRLAEARASDDV